MNQIDNLVFGDADTNLNCHFSNLIDQTFLTKYSCQFKNPVHKIHYFKQRKNTIVGYKNIYRLVLGFLSFYDILYSHSTIKKLDGKIFILINIGLYIFIGSVLPKI